MDMQSTIAPKSDQLNADDLIGGRTVTIKVTAIKGSSEPQQPVAIHYEGDNGKPYKPCKSMRRVLVSAWGANGADYVGRSMTLYRDDAVVFGGIQVGGIRISHLSHIDNPMTIALTASKTVRKPYTVNVLAAVAKVDPVAAINAAATLDELGKVWAGLTAPEKEAALSAKDKRKGELQS